MASEGYTPCALDGSLFAPLGSKYTMRYPLNRIMDSIIVEQRIFRREHELPAIVFMIAGVILGILFAVRVGFFAGLALVSSIAIVSVAYRNYHYFMQIDWAQAQRGSVFLRQLHWLIILWVASYGLPLALGRLLLPPQSVEAWKLALFRWAATGLLLATVGILALYVPHARRLGILKERLFPETLPAEYSKVREQIYDYLYSVSVPHWPSAAKRGPSTPTVLRHRLAELVAVGSYIGMLDRSLIPEVGKGPLRVRFALVAGPPVVCAYLAVLAMPDREAIVVVLTTVLGFVAAVLELANALRG